MSEDGPDETLPLLHARAWLRDRIEDGATCPCCTQFAKVYYRKVNSGMVRALAIMYSRRNNTYPFVHVSDLRSHEVAQLAWWGLVEEEASVRGDGGRIGWWRISDHGHDWLIGLVKIKTYARVYDGRLLGLTGDPRPVEDAVKDKFDLHELMEGR